MKHLKTYLLLLILVLFLYAGTEAQIVQFTNSTAIAGVAGSAGSPYSTHCAWGDYDNDGYLDVYVTNWGSAVSDAINELYKNNGNGTFTESGLSAGVNSSNNSAFAAWGDYDNDGYLDLYVVNFYEQDELYHNNGNGTFSDVTSQAGINIVSIGNEVAAAWGDYDNDGYLDLYICKYYANNELYHNNGNGTFSLIVDAAVRDIRDSEGASWVDFNNDGYCDLYVVNREQDNRFYKNNGDGTFTEISGQMGLNNTEIGKNGVWEDIDNDGDFDLYLANIGGNNLYLNNLTSFTDASLSKNVRYTGNGWENWDASFADVNGNGNVDLFTTGGSESGYDPTALFINYGSAYGYVFNDVAASAGITSTTLNATSCAFADYDNDGDPDIFVTTNSNNVLFGNQKGDDTNNFLKVRIHGKGSGSTNSFGFGCTVKIYETGTPSSFWLKELRNGSEPPELLFGLTEGRIYTAEIYFPATGQTSTIGNITLPRAEPLLVEEP